VKSAEQEFEDVGLKVIWMGFQDRKDKLMKFMKKHDVHSSVGFDERNMIAGMYGIAYGAGLIAINKDGIVTKRIAKVFSEEGLIEALEHAMQVTEAQEN
jgi:peroxiredoxin